MSDLVQDRVYIEFKRKRQTARFEGAAEAIHNGCCINSCSKSHSFNACVYHTEQHWLDIAKATLVAAQEAEMAVL